MLSEFCFKISYYEDEFVIIIDNNSYVWQHFISLRFIILYSYSSFLIFKEKYFCSFEYDTFIYYIKYVHINIKVYWAILLRLY